MNAAKADGGLQEEDDEFGEDGFSEENNEEEEDDEYEYGEAEEFDYGVGKGGSFSTLRDCAPGFVDDSVPAIHRDYSLTDALCLLGIGGTANRATLSSPTSSLGFLETNASLEARRIQLENESRYFKWIEDMNLKMCLWSRLQFCVGVEIPKISLGKDNAVGLGRKGEWNLLTPPRQRVDSPDLSLVLRNGEQFVLPIESDSKGLCKVTAPPSLHDAIKKFGETAPVQGYLIPTDSLAAKI